MSISTVQGTGSLSREAWVQAKKMTDDVDKASLYRKLAKANTGTNLIEGVIDKVPRVTIHQLGTKQG